MDNIGLTVLIPTYNRKEPLLKTLLALSSQSDKRFHVIISDNCSNYSIEKEVLTNLPEEFIPRIKVHHQRFNIGGDCNIIGLLALCETEYGWMLGDDDVVSPNAIETVYRTIGKYPDVSAFWFCFDEKVQTDNILHKLENLTDFLRLYENRGDFIFCSNKVYRISAIAPHITMAYRFVNTCIPHSLLLVEALKSNQAVGIIGNALLARSVPNRTLTWNVCMTFSGFKAIMNYPTGLPWKKHCLFVRSVMFQPFLVLRLYLMMPEMPWDYRIYLPSFYADFYRYCYPWYKRVVIKSAFEVASYRIGWKLLKLYVDFRDRNKDSKKEK